MGLFLSRNGDKKTVKPGLGDQLEQVITSPVQRAIPSPAEPSGNGSPVNAERAAYLAQMRQRLHQQLVDRLDVQNLRSTPMNVVRVTHSGQQYGGRSRCSSLSPQRGAGL